MTVPARRIYLDHNATAPLLPEARAAASSALDLVGNPSSVHEEGRRARACLEDARRSVGELLGADAANVVFTSGATEAANTCLAPEWMWDADIVSVTRLAVGDADHPATREGGSIENASVTRLPVDAAGLLDHGVLAAWLSGPRGIDAAQPRARSLSMLCLTLANSETGVLQDLSALRQRLAGRDVLFVLDVSQAAGRLPLSIAGSGADAMLLSGHKIGAPKGVGAYVLADQHRRPLPLLRGGGQERGMRAGTEALSLIAGFGAAARVAAARSSGDRDRLLALRERLVESLRETGAKFRIVGEEAERLPNTLCIAAPRLRAETAQIGLDLSGYAVSSGSACSSGKVGPSHVLAAMHAGGLDIDPAAGAIRVSFGYETTAFDIDSFADAFSRLLLRGQGEVGGRRAA